MLKDVGWEPKPGESDEQRTLRARLFNALGYDARDPRGAGRRPASSPKRFWTILPR